MAHTSCDRADKWVPIGAVPIARYNGGETHAHITDVLPGCTPFETGRLRNLRTTVACTSSREVNVRV
jgi:hypothetical protein